MRRYNSVSLLAFTAKIICRFTCVRREILTVNDAVAKRIATLLKKEQMSQYRLEQNSGVLHGTLNCIMAGKNKSVQLNTVMMIAKGFGMTLIEFLDDDVFRSDELEIEY